METSSFILTDIEKIKSQNKKENLEKEIQSENIENSIKLINERICNDIPKSYERFEVKNINGSVLNIHTNIEKKAFDEISCNKIEKIQTQDLCEENTQTFDTNECILRTGFSNKTHNYYENINTIISKTINESSNIKQSFDKYLHTGSGDISESKYNWINHFEIEKIKNNEFCSDINLDKISSKIFETPQNFNKSSNETVSSDNKEVCEFFARYNTIDKKSGLLSYKRKREQLIKESYEAFGFSFDSEINLKKGYSKVEKEKLILKSKRENQNSIDNEENKIIKDIRKKESELNINEYETNINFLEDRHSINEKINNNESFEEIKNKENKIPLKVLNNSFMQDAIVKKTRVERDKDLFLEEQKKLKENKNPENTELNNLNSTYMNFKEKKKALLNEINQGIEKNNSPIFF